MSFLIFLVEAALVSLSGVMAPGPITAATVGKGNESPHAGALVAVGHGIVEFPLIVCIWLGVASLDNAFLRPALGFVGGVVLLLMGIGMLRGATRDGIPSKRYAYSALGAGMILTAANPYFFVWWGTIGSWLVLQVIPFGIGGLVIFAIVHWLCDLAWCYFLSALTFKGGQFFGRRFQRVAFAASGLLLLLMSVVFLADAVRMTLA